MDTLTQASPVQRKPLPVFLRILCCIVFLLCSVAVPSLTHFINASAVAGKPSLTLNVIVYAVLGVCLVFAVIFCRKPVFLTCAILSAGLLAWLSPELSAYYVSLLFATLTGAALLTDAKGAWYLLFCLSVPVAFGLATLIAGNPLVGILVLVPAGGAVALAVCDRNKVSFIPSVSITTAAVLTLFAIILFVDLLVAGMPFSIDGVRGVIEDYHASLVEQGKQSIELLIEAELFSADITAEQMSEFAKSVATITLCLAPGAYIMLGWVFSFIAHRGYAALTLGKLCAKDCPAHLSAYNPSVPTAVLMLLCYAAMLIGMFFAGGEIVIMIALNLLLVLTPILGVRGIASIIQNFKRATFKWPLIITYAISLFILGLAVVPMLAFFGAFAVILQAIASALEKKMNSSQGGQ